MLQRSATLQRTELAACVSTYTPDDVVQTWVGELRGSVVVVHEVDAAGHSAPDFPAHWQRAELLAAHTGQIPTQTEAEDMKTDCRLL